MAARGGGRGFKRSYDNSRNGEREELCREPQREGKRTPVLNRPDRCRPSKYIAFDSRFVKALLGNVKVLLIGDSLMRGMYKDIVTWVQTNNLSTDSDLKSKAEATYKGDREIDISLLSDDKVFRQAREYQTATHCIQFLFTTRVMKDDMELLIQQMLGKDGYPDVILINSMIWDLTRYFKVSTDSSFSDCAWQKQIEIECIQKYLDRTSMFLRRLRSILPPHTMVIWVCFPHCRPSQNGDGPRRGMQNEPLAAERNHFIRSVMIDGSFRVSQVVRSAGYDVLDIGFYMRNHAFYHYQKADGMHWLPPGVRLMSQLVMQFLAKSWGIDTSRYFKRLEVNLSPKYLHLARVQLGRYSYYRKEIPKLHDELARKAFENLSSNDKYFVKSLIKYGRTLTPFVHPPRRRFRFISKYNPLVKTQREQYKEVVRLAPFIAKHRVTVEAVDEIAVKMQAVAIKASEEIAEKKK